MWPHEFVRAHGIFPLELDFMPRTRPAAGSGAKRLQGHLRCLMFPGKAIRSD